MKYLILPILLFTSGCGVFLKHTVDTELQPYVDHYEDAKMTRTGQGLSRAITVKFANFIKPTTLGRCTSRTLKSGQVKYTVRISPEKWYGEMRAENRRLYIMYHELGHCDLGFDGHYDGEVDIMNTKMPQFISADLWESLVDELFMEGR